ncbi:MAG: TonB-dependent receptor plug domain-containing protein, partial [Nitrospirota bacterium]
MRIRILVFLAKTVRLSFFNTLIILSSTLFSPAAASAQTEEEMKMLQMYFREDELVVSPTRTLKPISKVAENISVVTAEDIEAMNAHTVIEVLGRVPGVFIDLHTYDFGSDGDIYIQGSEGRHVLVLVDGLPWNFTGGGAAVTQTIPVRIIKRIEIIRGPASSSWGSALGGVINIITKDTKNSDGISGTVSASVGERDTHDVSAEVTSNPGIGYYLYA